MAGHPRQLCRLCRADLTLRFRPEIDHRDPHRPRLVGKIVGDARAREDDETDRHDLEKPVVAFEGRGLAVARSVWLEDDLCDAAVVGPEPSFITFVVAAVLSLHSGHSSIGSCLRLNLCKALYSRYRQAKAKGMYRFGDQ